LKENNCLRVGVLRHHPDGEKHWYKSEAYIGSHRVGGPSIVEPSGRKSWYVDSYLRGDHEIILVKNQLHI